MGCHRRAAARQLNCGLPRLSLTLLWTSHIHCCSSCCDPALGALCLSTCDDSLTKMPAVD
jgi:hypothetical protein